MWAEFYYQQIFLMNGQELSLAAEMKLSSVSRNIHAGLSDTLILLHYSQEVTALLKGKNSIGLLSV
jgi:hypothetical protein